jgi:hypothetical protein
MKKKNTFRWSISLLIIILLLTIVVQVFAIDTDEFVYAGNYYNGITYSSNFIPPKTNAIYLLANEDSILSARLTETYYWPLTNEIKASWDKQNEPVQGQLEILQNGQIISVLERTNYTIQYDANDMFGTIELYVGEEAIASRIAFEQAQLDYREALQAYNEAYNEYEAALTAFMEKVREEKLTVSEEDFPTEPQKSEDMSLYSTNLLQGFLINLPVGNYTIQFRLPDGSIQENSKKELTIFEAIQDGIGYTVFSKDRWTIDESNEEESQIIYTTKENTIFLQPYHQKQYNELYYLRMADPQETSARKDRAIWMPFSDLTDLNLLISNNKTESTISETDYYVQQTKGYTLGYDILKFDPQTMDKISFSAYGIDASYAGQVINIQATDSEGNLLPGSAREIRVINIQRTWVVYVLAVLPILLGIVFLYSRRKNVRNEKIIA